MIVFTKSSPAERRSHWERLNPRAFAVRDKPKISVLNLPDEIRFTEDVLTTFSRYKQHKGRDEAGGILLGSRYDKELVVDLATRPNAQDKCGPTFFERDALCAQKAINQAWQDSNGKRLYLGEWHSHAEPHPKPSKCDRDMIASMFAGATPQHGPLLLLIVGTRSLWLGCRNESGLFVYKRQPSEAKIIS